MTTEAQIEANRANAQKSTGPRTPEGKAKVAQNALKHGLLAQQAVVLGEDTDDFDLLRDQLYAEWAPLGPTEARLVERIAGLFWRLQRAERFSTESFDVMCQQCADEPQVKQWRPRIVPAAASPVVGLTVVKDFSETRVLERLLVCERRLENSLYRTMAELRQAQGRRQGAAGGPLGDSRSRRDQQDRGGPETRSPDFILADLLAKTGAQEDEPAGATTNTPPAEGQSCETKPICGGSGEDVGRGRPTYEETPDGVTTNSAGGPSCETKPIGEPATAEAAEPRDLSCETKPIGQSQSCETKPIFGTAGWDEAAGARDEGQSCQTKPICESPTAEAAEPVRSVPVSVTTNLPEAQGPSCETNPIGAGPAERQVPCSEGVRSHLVPSAAGETKPIPQLRIADCGPRSQPGVTTLRIQDSPAAGCPLPPAAPDLRGAVAQTNPIGQSQPCETKPIAAGAKRERFGYTPIFRRRR